LAEEKRTGLNLIFRVPSNDIIIHSDAFRLKQILSNLLDNAMKFTSRGKISLGCSIVGKELVFTVTDTGTGIPVADQGKIFDRFVKFDYRGNNSEGSGIGLSIVDRIVRLLNGRVWLTSVYGQGSSFYVSIPCAEPVSSETRSFITGNPGPHRPGMV
jgi:two-component system, sensor histidine kinase ChiS